MNHLRPLLKGESNLGSIEFLTVFTCEQFESFIKFPTRGKGEITDPIPIKYGEVGARWFFDVGKGSGSFAGTGPITNKTYKHTIVGKVSGQTREQMRTLDDVYNTGLIVIAHYPNGHRKVYGSTQDPLHLTDEGTTETAPESDGKGITVKLESIYGCDFPPRNLANDMEIGEATLLPYMNGGFTYGFSNGYNIF